MVLVLILPTYPLPGFDLVVRGALVLTSRLSVFLLLLAEEGEQGRKEEGEGIHPALLTHSPLHNTYNVQSHVKECFVCVGEEDMLSLGEICADL